MKSSESGGQWRGIGDVEVGEWTIDELLVRARVAGHGPRDDCRGQCCCHGVYVSLEERERILAEAPRIQAQMDESQTTDTTKWFDDELEEDEDFPAGLCVGTAVHQEKCTFLSRDGLCTLQLAEARHPGGPRLKPYYCRIFPLCTSGRRVEFDDIFDGEHCCCTLQGRGGTRAVEAYDYEFTEILGADAYRELVRRARALAGSTSRPKRR